MTCKQCNKELIQTEGRREKEFCDSTCRSKYWYGQNKKGKKKKKQVAADTEKEEPTKKVKETNPYDQKKDYMRWRQWENANK